MAHEKAIRLVYTGNLPHVNRQTPSYWHRWNLKKRCLRQFGELPHGHRAHQKAHVTIVRVLGPRQREMDAFENLPVSMKGLVDALVQGGYLVDDRPKWMSFELSQDGSRRHEGPRIEISIEYL